MPRRRAAESATILPPLRPALTPESREGQLIALAMDRVEERLRNGTASSQEIVHFLRLATTREQLELKKLEHETLKLDAQVKAIDASARTEEAVNRAISAFKIYSGHGDDDDIDFTKER